MKIEVPLHISPVLPEALNPELRQLLGQMLLAHQIFDGALERAIMQADLSGAESKELHRKTTGAKLRVLERLIKSYRDRVKLPPAPHTNISLRFDTSQDEMLNVAVNFEQMEKWLARGKNLNDNRNTLVHGRLVVDGGIVRFDKGSPTAVNVEQIPELVDLFELEARNCELLAPAFGAAVRYLHVVCPTLGSKTATQAFPTTKPAAARK